MRKLNINEHIVILPIDDKAYNTIGYYKFNIIVTTTDNLIDQIYRITSKLSNQGIRCSSYVRIYNRFIKKFTGSITWSDNAVMDGIFNYKYNCPNLAIAKKMAEVIENIHKEICQ